MTSAYLDSLISVRVASRWRDRRSDRRCCSSFSYSPFVPTSSHYSKLRFQDRTTSIAGYPNIHEGEEIIKNLWIFVDTFFPVSIDPDFKATLCFANLGFQDLKLLCVKRRVSAVPNPQVIVS